jgi:hypothetical protein
MERIFLYYPTIEFPKDNWLRQAILYSDKVSSILPYKDESLLADSLKFLLSKGEYKPIYVEDLIWAKSQEYETFAENFLNEIDNNHRLLSAGSSAPRKNVVNTLFTNKLSYRIIEELRHRGLATGQFDKKIFLPENVAIYYMAVLAKFVASVVEDDLIIPSTDYRRFSDISFENGIQSENAVNLIFQNCLPIPDNSVELSDIIDFKNKHRQELLKFRQFYTQTQNQIKECRDSIDLKESLLTFKEKIELELSELEKLYSKNKIKTIFSSFDSLFGIEKPKLFTSLLEAGIISTAIDPKIGIGIASVLVIGKIIDNIVSKPNKSNEFNYLFEARRKGIIK